MADIGDNSGLAVAELRQIVERIERLEDEIANQRLDVKEVYAEAKGLGYDTKALRKVVAMRKKDAQKLAEEQEVIDLYASALGVFG